MEKKHVNKTHYYGLIGRNISYSFSEKYFNTKFNNEKLTHCQYNTYDLKHISEFRSLLKGNKAIKGLSVTIPYKERILPYLDEIDEEAAQIGAVNAIRIQPDGKSKGFNTDAYGFSTSLAPLLKKEHTHALILGTGGASKAVAYSLKKRNIRFLFLSRNPSCKNHISYDALSPSLMETHLLIINCTPLGTFPDLKNAPDIPYQHLSRRHLLYDLIYNPTQTLFLKKGKEKGTLTINGLQMLYLQAEKAWEIWNTQN